MSTNYLFKSVLTLVLFTVSFFSFQMKAADPVVVDGIAYNVLEADAKTAQVVALPGGAKYTGKLTIAASVNIDGVPHAVKKIGNNSLRASGDNAASDNLTAVIIPDGLEIIGNSSFADCAEITSIQLPASVKTIEDWAFYGCRKLASINIPDGITAITEHTFQQSGLTSIQLPPSVTSLKVCAFQDAANLTSINLENIREIISWSLYGTALTSVELVDVPAIQSCAFGKCPNLESFVLKSESVTEFALGDWLFQDCPKLTKVELPDGLSTIGGGAFSGCSALASLAIPKSVVFIDNWSLEKTGLSEIFVSWADPDGDVYIEENAFGQGDGKSDFTWKVPAELLGAYGDVWYGYPVVAGTAGINKIQNQTVQIVNENHAIRIVDTENLNGTIDVYAANGTKVYTQTGPINNTIIELSAGMYIVKITSTKGTITGKTIVK